MSKLKVCVEVSEEWEGKKVVKDLVEKIKKKIFNPKFILLFSTIHYEKEFKSILSEMKKEFPTIPLVGGTVAGFITPENCYVRGVTVFVLEYPDMDVAVGIGYNTKRNPKKAASECVKMIKNGLKNSKYPNKFLFCLISGAEILDLPGVGRKSVIRSGPLAKTIMSSFKTSQYVLQKGFGREEEVLEEIIKQLPEYSLLHGSTMDDANLIKNFQFFNNNFIKNSVIVLGISTNLSFNIGFGHGMKKYTNNFNITKTSDNGQIIHEINNKPATEELLRLLNQDESFFEDKLFKKNFPYFPFGITYKKLLLPRGFTMILGKSILLEAPIKGKSACFLTTSGSKLVNAVDECFRGISKKNTQFGLLISCAVRLMTLGDKVYFVRDRLLDHFGKNPFLLIDTVGEAFYKKNYGLLYLTESIATACFGI